MEKKIKKTPRVYIVLAIVAVVALICALFIPEIGKFVLWDEACVAVVVLVITIMITKALVTFIKASDFKGIAIAGSVVLIFGLFGFSKVFNIVCDFVEGPTLSTISISKIERKSTSNGFFGLNYSLKGTDARGNSYRLSISGEEYENLNGAQKVVVLQYENTGRVVEIKKVSEKYE